jgi:hypothetical protein
LFGQSNANVGNSDSLPYTNIEAYKKDIYKPNADFFEIDSKMQNVISNYDTTQGMYPLKQYLRFKYFWENRVGSDSVHLGNFNDYNEIMLNYLTNLPQCNENGPNNIQWEQIGADYINKEEASTQLFSYNGVIVSVYMFSDNTNEILAGSNTAGVFKTIDGGDTWVCVTDNLNIAGVGISHFAVNPLNQDMIIASTGKSTYNELYGTGLLISYNRGDDWQLVNGFDISNNPVTVKTIINPLDTNEWFVMTTKKILYTPNHGANWSTLLDINQDNLFANSYQKFNDMILNGNGELFVGGVKNYEYKTKIWKSSSINNINSLSWQDISMTFANISALNPDQILEVKFTELNNGKFYVYIGDALSNYIYKTTNNGSSFTFFNSKLAPTSPYDCFEGGKSKIGFSQSLTGTDRVYTGGCKAYCATSSGFYNIISSYIDSNWHADIRCTQTLIDQNTGHELLLYGNDGGIQLLDVTGANTPPFYNTNDIITYSLVSNQIYDLAVGQFSTNNNTKKLFTGNQDNGTIAFDFDYNNGQGRWFHNADGDGGQCWIASDNSRDLYISNSLFNIEGLNGVLSYEIPYQSGKWGLNMFAEIDEKHDIFYFSENGLIDGSGNVTSNTKVIKKDNSQTTTLELSPFITKNIAELAYSENNLNIVYFSGGHPSVGGTDGENASNKLFKSIDGLQSYINLSESTVYNSAGGNPKLLREVIGWKKITAIEVNPNNADEIWIGISSITKSTTPVHQRYRVLHSTNGGVTWKDYSNGLPTLPVNCITYVKGTNNNLLIGTDIGIYYNKDNVNTWYCYNGDMPNTIVTSIEIDYCDNKIYTSTYGRGVWRTDLNIPVSNQYSELTIRNNQSIEETYNCVSSIKIEDGGVLTITGTLYMNRDTKITIKPGGKLIVNGGTITNGCGGLWDGIEVMGVSSDITQSETIQGQAIFNNATIEHATVAVRNHAVNFATNNVYWNNIGGIIKSTNSTFKNNRRAVAFLTYQRMTSTGHLLDDKSRFVTTNFIWDADFRHTHPMEMVSLYKVYGVTFMGCTFADDRPNATSEWFANNNSNFGTGIYSIDAQYYVYPKCNSTANTQQQHDLECGGSLNAIPGMLTPNEFRNLDFGIWASTAETEFTVKIDRNVFNNNYTGVKLMHVNNPVVTRNIYNIDNTTNNYVGVAPYHMGVYGYHTQGVMFEENTFNNLNSDHNSQPLNIGFRLADVGQANNRTYKNTFNNQWIATYASGDNNGNGGQSGLQFVCNNNNTNTVDHYVYNDGNGIRLWQGEHIAGQLTPAGNTFTQLNGYREDFWNNSQGVNYVDYTGIQNLQEYFGVNKYTALNKNNCHSSFSGGSLEVSRTQNINAFNTAKTQHNLAQTEYNNLINGGDTQALMTQISNLTTENKFQLRQTLLNNCPYLTEEVIKATIDNDPSKYPHWWAFELVLANIDVAKNDEFMDFLANKQSPMPYWMRWTINYLVQNSDLTLKQTKAFALATLGSQMDFAADQLILSYKTDTTETNIDSVKFWIEQKNNVYTQVRLIDIYLQKREYEQAQAVINQLLADKGGYPINMQDEINDLVDFKTRVKQILNEKGSMAQMSKNDHLFMTQMAENGNGSAKLQAQEVVCFFFNECKEEPMELPSFNTGKMQQPEEEVQPVRELNFKLYPNPANDWVAIELPIETQGALITIVDLNGKVVLQELTYIPMYIWETYNLPAGTYVVNIQNTTGTQKIGTQKIVIQH